MSWPYEKEISITTTSSNVAVPVVVDRDLEMAIDFRDLRFFDTSGEELFYYLPRGNIYFDRAIPFVRLSAKARATKKLKVKYGNRYCIPGSTGPATFALPQHSDYMSAFIEGGQEDKQNYQVVNWTIPRRWGMSGDFSNVRFVDAEGVELSYVLEGFVYGVRGIFSLLLPFHPTQGQPVYIYCGKGSATDQIVGNDVLVSHGYSSVGDRTITISQADKLTKFQMIQAGIDISFDLADLPSGLTYFRCDGSNTVSGDIVDAPRGLTVFYVSGNNTITGDIADAPRGLTQLWCKGSTTLSGDLKNLPSSVVSFNAMGENTISGDIADLPTNINEFWNNGHISTYTSGRTWTSSYNAFHLDPASGYGLSSEEVDNLLIDMANSIITAFGHKVIEVIGNNAPRTAASDDAVATLEGLGFTVTTN
jgi:hypothetical protein